PREMSQRGDSGNWMRSRIPTSASKAPMMYMIRQPLPTNSGPLGVSCTVARAKGSPLGKLAGGVVSQSPNQMPKKAPNADMMKIREVYLARPEMGAISLI